MKGTRDTQQARSERTREQLLSGARRAIAARGYDAASVDDIAESAGCSKGAFYFHFPAKDAVLVELADRWVKLRDEHLSRAAAVTESGFEYFLEAYLVVSYGDARDPRTVLEYFRQAERNSEVAKTLQRGQAAWRRLLVRLLMQRCQAAGEEAAEIADVVETLHRGLIVNACLDDGDGPSTVAPYVEILSRLLRPLQRRQAV
jgi:AcrR family transcriptional regulator